MNALVERRIEKREIFTVTVRYLAEMQEEDCTDGFGVTTNVSSFGVSLFLDCPFRAGQEITVYGGKFSNKPRKSEVIWCTKISDGMFRLGLRFTE